VHCMIWS